jgi:hypothetical protein
MLRGTDFLVSQQVEKGKRLSLPLFFLSFFNATYRIVSVAYRQNSAVLRMPT